MVLVKHLIKFLMNSLLLVLKCCLADSVWDKDRGNVEFLSMPIKVLDFNLIRIISLLIKWLVMEKICLSNLHPIQCLVPSKCSDSSQKCRKEIRAKNKVKYKEIYD